jgi:hypothetical protein
MGTLKIFDLNQYKIKNNLSVFVETGTYMGDSLDYASSFGFEDMYSIELLDKFYNLCTQRFSKNRQIKLIKNNSIDGLIELLPQLTKKNCLFWLDAHLPDFYDNSFGNDYLNNKEIFIPLEKELRIIKESKNIENDVFIIDDLRIYEKGNYQSGNWDGVLKNEKTSSGVNFIYDILSDTHTIVKDYRHEGYIICQPKKNL